MACVCTLSGTSPDRSSATSSSQPSTRHNKATIVIDTDPESIVSDYSEMGEQVREHLANVQIIRKEDLAVANTMPNEVLLQQKIARLPNETDIEFAKRLRKLNFLSLAQEFAQLKKVDSAALPFDAHKSHELISPQSDTASSSFASDSEREKSDSNVTTPSENSSGDKAFPGDRGGGGGGDAACNNMNAQLPDNAKLLGNANETQTYSNIESVRAPASNYDVTDDDSTSKETSISESADVINGGRQQPSPKHTDSIKAQGELHQFQHVTAAATGLSHNINPFSDSHHSASALPAHNDATVAPVQAPAPDTSHESSEHLQDFDVFNIESTMPEMDWVKIEEELRKASREEEQHKQVRVNQCLVHRHRVCC